MDKPEYIAVKWKHGWSLEGVEQRALPLDAFRSIINNNRLLGEGKLICPGIANHLARTARPNTVMAIASKEDGEKWKQEITASLVNLPSEQQWFLGCDTGISSLVIFSVLAKDLALGKRAKDEVLGRASTPQDSSDLKRCLRLIKKFPEWESRLPEVAAAYPDGKWAVIVENWQKLKAADPEQQSQLLRKLNGN